MENNENFVAEQVTENVETTTEQTPKMFTQDEVNEIVGKAKARIKKQHNREMEQYRELEGVLQAGLNKEDIGEITQDLRSFYGERKGIKMPPKEDHSAKENEILANHEAKEIISGGIEDVAYELDRLTKKGVDKMTVREKAVYPHLVAYMDNERTREELSKIGVTEDEYMSEEYQEFRKQFNSNVPEAKRYEYYRQSKPKKEIRTMGSMKNNPAADTGVKEFYSVEEARRFSKADFDKNPALFDAVQRSMHKWK
jgi:hypothetical protein